MLPKVEPFAGAINTGDDGTPGVTVAVGEGVYVDVGVEVDVGLAVADGVNVGVKVGVIVGVAVANGFPWKPTT